MPWGHRPRLRAVLDLPRLVQRVGGVNTRGVENERVCTCAHHVTITAVGAAGGSHSQNVASNHTTAV
eukprot:COSAG01_NODE_7056_length_3374_cov_1.996336_6_plen_67_part_00